MENWPTFYPDTMDGREIAQEMLFCTDRQKRTEGFGSAGHLVGPNYSVLL